jgi:hypothetical protein
MKTFCFIFILLLTLGCKVSYDKTHVESGSSNSGVIPKIYLKATICLEGAYDETATVAANALTLKSNLTTILPTSIPDTTYRTDSFLNKFIYLTDIDTHGGPIMGDGIDRVMVEVFQEVNNVKYLVSQQAALLSPDGSLFVALEYFGDGDYYLNIIHRNHLAIGNDIPITVTDGWGEIDFTKPLTPYLGEPAKTPFVLKNGDQIKCLLAGDLTFDHDDDGIVEIDGLDLTKLETTISNLIPNFACPGPVSSVVISGYKNSDLDFDGQTQACDPVGAPAADKLVLQLNLGAVGEIHKATPL